MRLTCLSARTVRVRTLGVEVQQTVGASLVGTLPWPEHGSAKKFHQSPNQLLLGDVEVRKACRCVHEPTSSDALSGTSRTNRFPDVATQIHLFKHPVGNASDAGANLLRDYSATRAMKTANGSSSPSGESLRKSASPEVLRNSAS